ncbi:FlgB family protein [Mesobaculum littorinae]|uniref:FlgB family protein n=1 Tax=Mesobaculum littorinae TaxID=2486419 RepID=UPI0019D4189F|nr:FlgB family protein [Mesobaculum littorinae]
MFEKLEVLNIASSMARHAGQRQSMIARNVANADTPGFKATDLTPFADLYRDTAGGTALRATREGHLHGTTGAGGLSRADSVMTTDQAAPNGNTVSLESEIMRGVETRHQHDTALSIYQKSLDILRISLGRGR